MGKGIPASGIGRFAQLDEELRRVNAALDEAIALRRARQVAYDNRGPDSTLAIGAFAKELARGTDVAPGHLVMLAVAVTRLAFPEHDETPGP